MVDDSTTADDDVGGDDGTDDGDDDAILEKIFLNTAALVASDISVLDDASIASGETNFVTPLSIDEFSLLLLLFFLSFSKYLPMSIMITRNSLRIFVSKVYL